MVISAISRINHPFRFRSCIKLLPRRFPNALHRKMPVNNINQEMRVIFLSTLTIRAYIIQYKLDCSTQQWFQTIINKPLVQYQRARVNFECYKGIGIVANMSLEGKMFNNCSRHQNLVDSEKIMLMAKTVSIS